MSKKIYHVKTVEEMIFKYLPEVDGLAKTIFIAMNDAVKNGGKRVRPALMFEAFQMFGGKETDVVSAFMAAIEMIHTSSLIHDDLPCMDNDVLRRGKPTTWVTFGEDMAVLAGDALIVEASRITSKAIANAKDFESMKRAALAKEILDTKTGIHGMIAGQVVDVEKTGSVLTSEELDFIYRLKTGALLEASLMIGATLAAASEANVARMEKIARNIGMAFQIQDDILDEISTEEELGKPIHSDEKNHKTTYVSVFGIEKAKQRLEELSADALMLLEEIKLEDEARDVSALSSMTIWLTQRTH